jgi:hypothetical protein
MKKILLILFIFMMFQTKCFAQTGVTFLYINGSNNNDARMKNWYENGVKKLHPYLKKEFETNPLSQKYFLKDGKYFINKDPDIFFWGDKSHEDLSFVERNLAISKSFSTWLAYQVRYALTCFLHDAIWVQKYHNMLPILEDLHEMVKIEAQKGNKVVLYGYSAGSFITYHYLLIKAPYINVIDFFSKVNATKEEKEFVAKHPMKNTCMDALGQELAVFSAAGHIVPNDANEDTFKKDYMNLDNLTDKFCIPDNAIKGIVNFGSPLVLFYSDISDPNFDLTYYNRLLFKYIIENDMFLLTVNYRADPLGFPGGRNLSIEEMEKATNIDIEPHAGFIYDQSDTWGRNSALATHTSYWATRQIFSKAVVRAYVNGYRHEYDDYLKQKKINKYIKKINILP